MVDSADSDVETGKPGRSRRLEQTKPWQTAEDVPWTLLTESELAEAYESVVAPALRRDGQDPGTERPTYEWLSRNGFRSLTYTLREHHDTTLADWWAEHIDSGPDSPSEYQWDIEDDDTRASFREYLDAKAAATDDWSDATRETVRYRLARYARSYRERHGTDDLLTPVASDSDVDETEAVDRCRATLQYMGTEYASSTVARVHDAVRAWYSWLADRRVAAFNPTDGAADWFRWDRSTDGDPVALETAHVRSMFEAAETTRNRMLVVALCGWGLRAGEVAALHADQLVLDDERPRITFDERKNGPGSVAIVTGVETARDRLATTTGGYLFPSERAATGHIHRTTVADWFHDLAARAGVPDTIDGQRRKPHMGRRWWYDRYSATLEDMLEHVEQIATEQGSTSARVVLDSYLSEDRRRELRREFMRERLGEAFEES